MGTERKVVQNAVFFRGKRHANQILKVQILSSRNFVVIAQAPTGGHLPDIRNHPLIIGCTPIKGVMQPYAS